MFAAATVWGFGALAVAAFKAGRTHADGPGVAVETAAAGPGADQAAAPAADASRTVTPDPIEIVRVVGSHREVGRQMGESARDAIQERTRSPRSTTFPPGGAGEEQLALAGRVPRVHRAAAPLAHRGARRLRRGGRGRSVRRSSRCSIEEIWYEPRPPRTEGRCSDLVAGPTRDRERPPAGRPHQRSSSLGRGRRSRRSRSACRATRRSSSWAGSRGSRSGGTPPASPSPATSSRPTTSGSGSRGPTRCSR